MSWFIEDIPTNTRQSLPKSATYGLSGNHGALTGRSYRRAQRSAQQALETRNRLKAQKALETRNRLKARKLKSPTGRNPAGLENGDTSEESTYE
jgi:hypothetical protein